MSVVIETRGFEEAVELLQDLDLEDQLESTLTQILKEFTRFAAANTPVVTGSMRSAWRWAITGLIGRLFIDPSAVNTRSGIPVSQYAPPVEERYGIFEKVEASWDRIGVEDAVGWEVR